MDASTGNDPEVRDKDEQAWCAQIAGRIGAGDSQAEALLIGRLQPGLRMILRSRCQHDPSLVADLCQDTLVIILKRLRDRSISDPSRIAAFAAQTARQLAFDALRRDLNRRTIVDSEAVENAQVACPSDDAPDRESIFATVSGLLAELSQDRDREILRRFYLLEEEKSEICRRFNLASGVFDQVVFRARARLREMLAAKGLRSHDLLCLLFLGVPKSWVS